MRRVAAEGHWPGGVPPFGLARRRTEADRHTRVVLDEDEAATARAAAALVVDDGLSVADAAARLNALGHRTRTGTRWGPKSLRRMLLADHLTGTYLWAAGSRSPSKSEPIAIPVPAVFSPERHAEVRLALGPEAVTSPPKGRAVYLLSRRVASPCGKHYWGRPLGRDGSRRYLCADEAARCGCPRLDAERVESRVWQEVTALLTDRERLTAMAQHYLATQAERVGGRRHDVAGVEAKIAKLERALNETVVDYAREGVPAAVVRAATDTLAGELSQLRRHRADLLRWRSAEEASQRHRNRLWALARTAGDRLHTMGDDERAALLAMLAVQVTVTGTSRCPQCDGRGRVGGRQGGYRCGRCRGMRTLVDLRIDGEVMDDLDYRLGADGRQGHLVAMPSAVSNEHAGLGTGKLSDMGLDVRIEAGTEKFDPGDERWLAQVSDLVASLEQGVGGVRHERSTVPGAKGGSAEIILALGSSGAVAAAVTFFKAWLDRDRSRSLDISYSVDGREERVTLKGDAVDKTAINAVAEAMAARLAAV